MITTIPGAVLRLKESGPMTGGNTPWKFLFHATISPADTVPGYNNDSYAPHATITCNLTTRKLTCTQHIKLNQFAKGLQNKSGGVETNRDNVIQIELAGYLGSSIPAGQLNLETVPAWYLDQLALILKPVIDSYLIRNIAPTNWTQTGRMTYSQWDSFAGWVGHVHVPENDHWDPGKFPISGLMSRVYSTPVILKPPVPAPVMVRPVVRRPGFPLPVGHWFGVKSDNTHNHSGYYSVIDRNSIRLFQAKLRLRGWKIDVDGFFGPNTASIVTAFQHDKRLTADGKVGPQTWRAIWATPVT